MSVNGRRAVAGRKADDTRLDPLGIEAGLVQALFARSVLDETVRQSDIEHRDL